MDPVFWWLAGKILFYVVMAGVAIPLLRLAVPDSARFVIAYGALRVVVGLLSAVVILLVYQMVSTGSHAAMAYILSFGVIRYFEWLLVLWVISFRHHNSLWTFGWRGQLWVLVGVAGNIVFDRIAVLAKFTDLK